jgi:hypothetical protein
LYIPSGLPNRFTVDANGDANGDGQGDAFMEFFAKPTVVKKALEQISYEPLSLTSGLHSIFVSVQGIPFLTTSSLK